MFVQVTAENVGDCLFWDSVCCRSILQVRQLFIRFLVSFAFVMEKFGCGYIKKTCRTLLQ